MNPFEEDELFRQRQQKQVFLKQEIIEKGYDGAQFAEYLNGIKAEGTYTFLNVRVFDFLLKVVAI